MAALAMTGCGPRDEDRDGENSEPAPWVVFSSGRSGDGDVLAVQPATGELREIVATPAPEGAPGYDPASNRLVHTRFSDGGGTVFAGDAPLFEHPDPDGSISWSVDGRIA